MTIATNNIYYGGDYQTGSFNPGTYIIEVRIWNDNNVDTGEFELLTITIEDPCTTATMTIDDSVFKPLS